MERHPDRKAPGSRDPTPGEAAQLPDIVVSSSWGAGWVLELQALGASQGPCAGREAEMQHF